MTIHLREQELLMMLEEALGKQILALRAMLSSLVEEEQGYHADNQNVIDDLLDKRLLLLETYENAEAKSVPLIELYLLEREQPPLLKNGLKVHQLSAFKAALSLHDLNLSMQVDQLISLLNKIQSALQ